MKFRTQFAILHNNWNAGRKVKVATTSSGEAWFKRVFPKLQKKWVAKPIYEEKTHGFVEELMRDTISLKHGEIEVPVAPLQKPVLPQNIAPTLQGSKQEIVSQHMSRFL